LSAASFCGVGLSLRPSHRPTRTDNVGAVRGVIENIGLENGLLRVGIVKEVRRNASKQHVSIAIGHLSQQCVPRARDQRRQAGAGDEVVGKDLAGS
jgi:hypothetical protein